jgi:hypothetical protein
MENTITRDYVSEKVYDALAAGCIPIYWGAPNIGTYIPQEDSIINLAHYNNIAQLAADLDRLANNELAYNKKLAWKTQPMERLDASE